MTKQNGHMSFRVFLPLERAGEFEIAAADGQMGCIMKLYRDWKLYGDDALLQNLWPGAKRALEFAWIPGGWDADKDGVMEGAQHNTTDLEFYGPNPLMAGWYLGALRAAEEMARYLGLQDFAADCRSLYEQGSRWVDANLFNGEYYEQEIRAPASADEIATGLTGHAYMEREDVTDPPQQMGSGCITDQLVGQFMAHICHLGHLLKPDHIAATLESVLNYNFLGDLYEHANPARAFAVNDEKMLVYGTYPRGNPPERPCFRFTENWTGIEYAAAVLMMQEGKLEEGLSVFEAIRQRFDGYKRNPFNEPECGHHYSRAMAAWAGVLTLTGFDYSGVDGTITFAASDQPARFFWSNGYAWGTCRQSQTTDGIAIEIAATEGQIRLTQVVLKGYGHHKLAEEKFVRPGETFELTITPG